MGRTKRIRSRIACRDVPDKNVSENDCIIKLLRWMKLWKWKSVSEMQPTEFSPLGLRGLMAKHKIDSSDILVKIPINLLITRSTAIKYIEKSKLVDCDSVSFKQMTTLEVLAIFLLLNKLQYQASMQFDRFWIPYIDTLPTSYEVPYFCDDDEVRTMLLHVVNIIETLAQISTIMELFRNFSFLLI